MCRFRQWRMRACQILARSKSMACHSSCESSSGMWEMLEEMHEPQLDCAVAAGPWAAVSSAVSPAAAAAAAAAAIAAAAVAVAAARGV